MLYILRLLPGPPIDTPSRAAFAQFVTCYLQCTADPKLHGRRACHKVQRLEHVTQRPHHNHRDAHAERRFVVEVAQKLRQSWGGGKDTCEFNAIRINRWTPTQHRLGEDGKEADRLHEPLDVQQQIRDGRSDRPEDQHKVEVRLEVRPGPEVAPIKVYTCAWANGFGRNISPTDRPS